MALLCWKILKRMRVRERAGIDITHRLITVLVKRDLGRKSSLKLCPPQTQTKEKGHQLARNSKYDDCLKV
jgi:hypothetical protein